MGAGVSWRWGEGSEFGEASLHFPHRSWGQPGWDEDWPLNQSPLPSSRAGAGPTRPFTSPLLAPHPASQLAVGW